nr:ATP-binding protein [Sphingomonas caseinilyticus]
MASRAAKRLAQSKEELEPRQEVLPLPIEFAELRERQALAVQNSAYRCSLLIGPPGTGKSFTIGALGAYLLTRHPGARLLVVGPTNVAVDTALLAIDDWLTRIGRTDLARRMKRIGAHFDPRKYVDRPHLLAAGVAEKVTEYLMLELAEPPKSRIGEYAKWKDRIGAARAALAADIGTTSSSARVVGVTVSTALRWHEALTEKPFPFVICDEASQIIGPAAMMIAALGQQTVFAGDPQQLAPIVRTDDKAGTPVLKRNAFDIFQHVKTVHLNEQSRMSEGICRAVGSTFYGNDLIVCRKAARDPEWKQARSPYFVDGREVPRICFDPVSEAATFSAKYGGFIRFQSAKLIEEIADELAGSYVDPSEILVLTPYRAQRALVKLLLKKRHPTIAVSTVHRAQGSERTVVIFDPVDASSQFLSGADGNRLINVAVSRAKAHVVIPYHQDDLKHPALAKIHGISSKIWQTKGDYSRPFTFGRST